MLGGWVTDADDACKLLKRRIDLLEPAAEQVLEHATSKLQQARGPIFFSENKVSYGRL